MYNDKIVKSTFGKLEDSKNWFFNFLTHYSWQFKDRQSIVSLYWVSTLRHTIYIWVAYVIKCELYTLSQNTTVSTC